MTIPGSDYRVVCSPNGRSQEDAEWIRYFSMLPFKAIANGLSGAVGDMVGNIPIIGG